MALHNPGEDRRNKVFKEVFSNTPKTVKKSKSKSGQRRQKVAIALSKLRNNKS